MAMTTFEVFKALVEGKKLRNSDWDKKMHICFRGGALCLNNVHVIKQENIGYYLNYTGGWEIYKNPDEVLLVNLVCGDKFWDGGRNYILICGKIGYNAVDLETGEFVGLSSNKTVYKNKQ